MLKKYRKLESAYAIQWDGKIETFVEIKTNFNRFTDCDFFYLKKDVLHYHHNYGESNTEIITFGTYIVYDNYKFIILNEENFKSKYASIENDNIPIDAANIEVFSIQNSEAFVGYKNDMGNFHFVQYPITDPKYKDPKKLGIPNICFSLTQTDDKREELYSTQRIERGFDDSETWSLADTIGNFIIPRLERFIKLRKERTIGNTHDYEKMLESFKLIVRDRGLWEFTDKEQNIIDNGLKLFTQNYFTLQW